MINHTLTANFRQAVLSGALCFRSRQVKHTHTQRAKEALACWKKIKDRRRRCCWAACVSSREHTTISAWNVCAPTPPHVLTLFASLFVPTRCALRGVRFGEPAVQIYARATKRDWRPLNAHLRDSHQCSSTHPNLTHCLRIVNYSLWFRQDTGDSDSYSLQFFLGGGIIAAL